MEIYMCMFSIYFGVLVITDKLFEQWHVKYISITVCIKNYELYPVILRFTKLHHISSEFFGYLFQLRNASIVLTNRTVWKFLARCDELRWPCTEFSIASGAQPALVHKAVANEGKVDTGVNFVI